MRRAAVALLLLAAGCRPELGDRASLVTEPIVLAVIAEPAEAAPGDEVAYEVIVATPDGAAAAGARWAYCTAPKPLTENNSVAAECLDDAVIELGGPAAAVSATVPADACARYGPDPPPGQQRPRDPDVTGGYYQPVRVEVDGLIAFGMQRLACNLGSAPVEVANDYRTRYQRNQRPALGELAAPARVEVGAEVELAVDWPGGTAETYLVYDVAAQELVEAREALRVSWYVTAGALGFDRTGRDESDPATGTSNTWTAPDEPGPVQLWLVLRDSRGGVSVATHELTVVP